MRVGINGFGRLGRLALRAGWNRPGLELVAINEPDATAESLALQLEVDPAQGRWSRPCAATEDGGLRVGDRHLVRIAARSPLEIPWRELGVEAVVECSDRARTMAGLAPHLENGARRVVVAGPVPGGPPALVVGVNDESLDLAREPVVAVASPATACLAPVARVLHDTIGIERGLVTAIHDPTHAPAVIERASPRRGRAARARQPANPTDVAEAVMRVVPELTGRLVSVAVRAPLTNASIVDLVFHASRPTSAEEVNGALERASRTPPTETVLGFTTRPIAGTDCARDPRSAVVDGLSTRVSDHRLVKVIAWHDRHWGHANRVMDLLQRVAAAFDESRDASGNGVTASAGGGAAPPPASH